MADIDVSYLSLPLSYPSVPSGVDTAPHDPYACSTHALKTSYRLFAESKVVAQRGPCRLLSLPSEIRQHLLRFILPHTVTLNDCSKRSCHPSQRVDKIFWRRGCTAILAVNQQLWHEAAAILYGDAVFNLIVTYNGITFQFDRLLDSGLRPKQTPKFESIVRTKYWSLLKRVRVDIRLEDPYDAEIKYGFGGAGLIAGVAKQTTQLVNILRSSEALQSLEIALLCEARQGGLARDAEPAVLKPFLSLRSVRSSSWLGVDPAIAQRYSDQVSCEKTATESASAV